MDPKKFTFHVGIPLFLQCRGMYSYPLIQLVTVRLVVDPHGTFVARKLASSDPPLNFLVFARLCYHCLPPDVGFLRCHRGHTDRPSKSGDLWLWFVERWGRVQARSVRVDATLGRVCVSGHSRRLVLLVLLERAAGVVRGYTNCYDIFYLTSCIRPTARP